MCLFTHWLYDIAVTHLQSLWKSPAHTGSLAHRFVLSHLPSLKFAGKHCWSIRRVGICSCRTYLVPRSSPWLTHNFQANVDPVGSRPGEKKLPGRPWRTWCHGTFWAGRRKSIPSGLVQAEKSSCMRVARRSGGRATCRHHGGFDRGLRQWAGRNGEAWEVEGKPTCNLHHVMTGDSSFAGATTDTDLLISSFMFVIVGQCFFYKLLFVPVLGIFWGIYDSLLLCFFASLLLHCSASLLFPASTFMLLCFSASPLFCFSAVCFSAFLLSPAFLCFCASLLLCFSTVRFFAFSCFVAS